MSDAPLMRTYKFRLLPRKAQHRKLKAALDHTRHLYNAALEERIDAYRKAGVKINYAAQSRGITEMRQHPDYSVFPFTLQLWPLRKVDQAFAAFFRRLKDKSKKPGFPRFRSAERFNSFGFAKALSWRLQGSRLYMQSIGRVRVHLHRPLPSSPTFCTIKRDGKGWIVLLGCEVDAEALAPTESQIGLDLGITSFIATSDGETIPGFRAGRRAQAEMRRRQRALARCKRGSNSRRKAKARVRRVHERTANARRTFQHQLAMRLIREHGLIAIEDLNVKGLARSMLARDVNDAGWGSFTTLLAEKAERAARTLVKVDPRHTSQTCPDCGAVKPKELKQRIHRCDCGCTLDRDVAAAKVVLLRAIASPRTLNLKVA
jgi:putative transposase